MSEEEVPTEETPKPRHRRQGWTKPGAPTLALADVKAIVREAVGAAIEEVEGKLRPKPLDLETKAAVDQGFKSQIEKYHAEPHYWVTAYKMGEDDNIDTVDLVAAGVTYSFRKGERVLLPQSAINCLRMAVVDGIDHGNPVRLNGRKYFRKKKDPRFNYTVEPEAVSPEDAAVYRASLERQLLTAQELIPADGGNALQDLIDAGPA